MSIQTRSKSRKQVMPGDEANSNRKLDDILSKMDVLLQAKTEMLMKLSTLEQTQATVVKDVNELKNNFKDTDLRILVLNLDLALRAKQTEVAASPKPRPIHVYLLRYTDKEKILKVAPSKFKNNYYKDLPIFISDNVSKSVREDRATLWRIYLADIKGKPNVIFAFIPWSVPAQILYKEEGADKLKSSMLPNT